MNLQNRKLRKAPSFLPIFRSILLHSIPYISIFLYLFAVPAKAQDFSLSLSPPLLEVMLQPGKSITQAYEVKNQGSSTLYLKSFISPFLPDPESGQIVYQDLLSPGQQPEFKLNNANIGLNDTFVLQAGESQQLVLKVTAPKDLAENDYYFTFFVSHSNKGGLVQRTTSNFQAQVGAHLLLTVTQSGQLELKGEIREFQALPKIADLGSLIKFKVAIANQGSAFFKTAGQIEIFDSLGKKRKELLLRPDNVLASSQKELTCLDEFCEFSSFFPGRYRAKLTIAPSGLKPVITQTLIFWIVPFKIILVIIIAIFMGKLVLDKKIK